MTLNGRKVGRLSRIDIYAGRYKNKVGDGRGCRGLQFGRSDAFKRHVPDSLPLLFLTNAGISFAEGVGFPS